MALEKKDFTSVDDEVQKYLKYFEISGTAINLKGSSQYKALKYKSDYDLLISIKREAIQPAFIFNSLRQMIDKIKTDQNVFFIELKLHCKDDKKIKYHHKDKLSYSDFENYYNQLKFFKVDLIICIKNKLYEASCIYNFISEELLKKEEVIKDI